MKGIRILLALVAVGVTAVLVGASQLMASDGPQVTKLVAVEPDANNVGSTRLSSFEEVPALSTFGGGLFDISINSNDSGGDWRMSYSGLQGNVLQAHIHFAQRGVNGGIVIFLCSNLGNGPAGTQLCPASGNINGIFNSSSVTGGASAQGISPGELSEVLRAMRNNVTYANIHTDMFPGGEIRGQLIFTPDDRATLPGTNPSGPTSIPIGR